MLGGLDAIVFTAGIGERSAPVRAAVAQRLAWLGAELDEGANAAGGPRISSAGSRLALLVVPTDEEAIIVRHTRSEEHTSELQSLMRISYAVFCLKTNTDQDTTMKCQVEYVV